MRSSQAARGLLRAVGKAAAATGADRTVFGLMSGGGVTSSFADMSLSDTAFLAVKDAAALEAGSAARTALPAADAAGRGADAAARAGTAAEAAIWKGAAGSDAGGCGAALLADAIGATGFGVALGLGLELGLGLGSSLTATPATTSAAKPATSQSDLRGEAASAA